MCLLQCRCLSQTKRKREQNVGARSVVLAHDRRVVSRNETKRLRLTDGHTDGQAQASVAAVGEAWKARRSEIEFRQLQSQLRCVISSLGRTKAHSDDLRRPSRGRTVLRVLMSECSKRPAQSSLGQAARAPIGCGQLPVRGPSGFAPLPLPSSSSSSSLPLPPLQGRSKRRRELRRLAFRLLESALATNFGPKSSCDCVTRKRTTKQN